MSDYLYQAREDLIAAARGEARSEADRLAVEAMRQEGTRYEWGKHQVERFVDLRMRYSSKPPERNVMG